VRANIARIVPDDLFLSAVPLHFEPNCPSSFVAIWRGPDSMLAGVTVNRALTAVFHFPCGDDDTGALTAHIGRLRRYWNRQHPRERFPDTLFVIGEAEAHIDEPVAVKRVTVTQNGVEVVDPAALRAIGAALSLDSDFGPVFREAAPEAAYLRSRAALLAVSGVVLIATICAWGGLAAANAWHRRTLDQAQQHYRELITTNADIKSMLAKSNTLARRIMLIERQRTLRTSWGRFLDAIGKRRPTDLYIERIGSQPDERNPDMVTVKLAGWSKSESSITSFMGALQSTARVSKPELASMTRDAKQKSTTRFLIVCTLKLTAK
jgi:Tfp pilus assembly protein PilN